MRTKLFKYIIITLFAMVATFLIYNLTQFYELAKQSQIFVTVSSLLLAVVLGTLALLSNSFKVQKSKVIPFALVYLGFAVFFMYSANDKGLLLLTIINLMLSSFSYGNMLNNKVESTTYVMDNVIRLIIGIVCLLAGLLIGLLAQISMVAWCLMLIGCCVCISLIIQHYTSKKKA